MFEETAVGLVFWGAALCGSAIFVLKTALLLLGVSHGGVDAGHGLGGGDMAGTDHPVGHTDTAARYFSIDSISAFFMLFGWVGLACLREFGLGPLASSVVGFMAGTAAWGLMATLLRMLLGLQSSGAAYAIESIIGTRGTVYQRIPAQGTGRIQIVLAGAMREIDASSEDRVDIESRHTIEVVRKISDELVSVRTVR